MWSQSRLESESTGVSRNQYRTGIGVDQCWASISFRLVVFRLLLCACISYTGICSLSTKILLCTTSLNRLYPVQTLTDPGWLGLRTTPTKDNFDSGRLPLWRTPISDDFDSGRFKLWMTPTSCPDDSFSNFFINYHVYDSECDIHSLIGSLRLGTELNRNSIVNR